MEPIRTVAVIGAGQQGRSFALRCAEAGFDTVLEDVMPVRLREAREEMAHRGEPAASERLRLASTVEDAVRAADLAIDFVPDELESKLEIFSMIDRMAPPRTILCTPTATLEIADLAACTYRAERCVALHGDHGPEKDHEAHGNTPSLEGAEIRVITGPATEPEIAAAVAAWLQTLGYRASVHAEAATSPAALASCG